MCVSPGVAGPCTAGLVLQERGEGMRNLAAEQLHSIAGGLVDMTRHVQQAVNRATHALLTADPHVADQVIAGDAQIDLFRDRIRSEEHTSELQSRQYLVCRLLLEKKKKIATIHYSTEQSHTY